MVGELREPLGGRVVAEEAVVNGELGELASEPILALRMALVFTAGILGLPTDQEGTCMV